MKISISKGRWFDLADAIQFAEATAWDGEKWISCATLSAIDSETLFFTRRGGFVIRYSSGWEAGCERYEQVPAQTAAAWLVDNHHAVNEKLKRLPNAVQREVRTMIRECEV
jgi:hypothetical protein